MAGREDLNLRIGAAVVGGGAGWNVVLLPDLARRCFRQLARVLLRLLKVIGGTDALALPARLTMYILGINAYHGDAAAAIVKDGRLIAAV